MAKKAGCPVGQIKIKGKCVKLDRNWKLANEHNSYYELNYKGPINIASTWFETYAPHDGDTSIQRNKQASVTKIGWQISNQEGGFANYLSENKKMSVSESKEVQKYIMKTLGDFVNDKKDWWKTVDKLNLISRGPSDKEGYLKMIRSG